MMCKSGQNGRTEMWMEPPAEGAEVVSSYPYLMSGTW